MKRSCKQAPAEVRAVIEALQALRGVAQTTAATVVCELGSLSRFESPSQLMGYSVRTGATRKYSSGNQNPAGARSPKAATCAPTTGAGGDRPGHTGTGLTFRAGYLRRQEGPGDFSEEAKADSAWKERSSGYAYKKVCVAYGSRWKNQRPGIYDGARPRTAGLCLGDRGTYRKTGPVAEDGLISQ